MNNKTPEVVENLNLKYPNFVMPKVYWIGCTEVNWEEIENYLRDTDQLEFLKDIEEARKQGLNGGEILVSFYAKACYSSLTDKKNKNITKIRDIENNVMGVIDSGHGSVTEHVSLNFMITNCSRVFTHELVRHRVGTAFSQTSGRYVRADVLNLVIDPILEPCYDIIDDCRKYIEQTYKKMEERLNIDNVKDFATKKKLTSSMRRLIPNGVSNEIGFSVNLRTLRQTIEARTSEHAEWEIRLIFEQIYNVVKSKFPIMFFDATEEIKGGIVEVKFKNKKI
jgi:thymidylate synthase (FAD)